MEVGNRRHRLVIGLLADFAMLELVPEDPFPFGIQLPLVACEVCTHVLRPQESLVLPLPVCEKRVVLGYLQRLALPVPHALEVLHPFVEKEKQQVAAFGSVAHLARNVEPLCLVRYELPVAHHSLRGAVEEVLHFRAVMVVPGRLHEVLNRQRAYVLKPQPSR